MPKTKQRVDAAGDLQILARRGKAAYEFYGDPKPRSVSRVGGKVEEGLPLHLLREWIEITATAAPIPQDDLPTQIDQINQYLRTFAVRYLPLIIMGGTIVEQTRNFALLNERVAELEKSNNERQQLIKELAKRVLALESSNAADSTPTTPFINWPELESVMSNVAKSLGWRVEVRYDSRENLVRIIVPEDQEEHVGETTFNFYEKVASALPEGVFRAIEFDFGLETDQKNG